MAHPHSPTAKVLSTLSLYQTSAKSAFRALFRNPLVIVGSIALVMALGFLQSALMGLGFIGATLVDIARFCAYATYYGWLKEIVIGNRLKPKDFFSFQPRIFLNLIEVAFVLWLVGGSLAIVTNQDSALILLFHVLALVICNVVPEMAYQHSMIFGFAAVKEAYNFVVENWLTWYPPLILIIIPWAATNPDSLAVGITSTDPLMPLGFIYIAFLRMMSFALGSWQSYAVSILAIALGHWFMLFRGFLYQDISSGVRRRGWR